MLSEALTKSVRLKVFGSKSKYFSRARVSERSNRSKRLDSTRTWYYL
jgi:hypothetical protein